MKTAIVSVATAALIVFFQNCAPANFSAGTEASSGASTEAGTKSCSPQKGQSCQSTRQQNAPGCGQGYGCATFEGIYYDSPSGCSDSASSFIEYRFDGIHELGRGKSSGGTISVESIIGDTNSAYHCTYVGFSDHPLSVPLDGMCHLASRYSLPNTYVRIEPGSGCSHPVDVAGPGTVQCDGSCQ